MEIFAFEFIRKAFLAGILLSLILPCIGLIVVLKRLSLVGDALSHASLVGVTSGLLFGYNPMITSVVVCILAALAMEMFRKYIPNFKENAMIIVLSSSVALAGIFASRLKTSVSFSSYLFGSIVSVTDFELLLISILVVIILITFLCLYASLFQITLDERQARLMGIKVDRVNFIFTVVTAITVAIASKAIGVLIVSSLLVVPVLCAIQVSKSYKQTLLFGVLFSIGFTVVGLIISYYLDLRPGGAITLLAVMMYTGLLIFKRH